MVAEAIAGGPVASLNATVKRIGPRVGIVPDILRGWVKQARIDTGQTPGTTTGDAATIKQLQADEVAGRGAEPAEWRPPRWCAAGPGEGRGVGE